MEHIGLFETFEKQGTLKLPDTESRFADIPWSKHPTFDGVELKHIVTSQQTGGVFSYHLVRIAPGKSIGTHIHGKQLETHEIIAGKGICINAGNTLCYKPGVISILPMGVPHEVTAGDDGLYLFAKFIPALN